MQIYLSIRALNYFKAFNIGCSTPLIENIFFLALYAKNCNNNN